MPPLNTDQCILIIRALVRAMGGPPPPGEPSRRHAESTELFLAEVLEVLEGLLNGSITPIDFVPRMGETIRLIRQAAPGHADINTEATRLLALFDTTVLSILEPEEQAKHSKVHLGVKDLYFENSCYISSKKITQKKSTLKEECEKLYKCIIATGTVHSSTGHQQIRDKNRLAMYIKGRVLKLQEKIGESLSPTFSTMY